MTIVVKITRREMSNLFFKNYDIVKCRRNMNFEEIGTDPSTGKNEGF